VKEERHLVAVPFCTVTHIDGAGTVSSREVSNIFFIIHIPEHLCHVVGCVCLHTDTNMSICRCVRVCVEAAQIY
jgi:hypothetical protein